MSDLRRVLIVDDEVPLAQVIASYFTRDGYEVTVSHTGDQALEQAATFDPDLVILDVMLPGIDGLGLCRMIRDRSDCYILMLTARDSEADKLQALSTGADDYVVKPCSPRELLARAAAMLRRPRMHAFRDGHRALIIGGLVIDALSRTVTLDDTNVDLTRTEFDILSALASAPGQAMSRSEIIQAVWGPSWYGDEQIVDVHIAAIRRKIQDSAAAPRFLRTVRGIGYALEQST